MPAAFGVEALNPARIDPIWQDEPCFVVATGPSLTSDVIRAVRMARWLQGWRVLLVNDAYKVLPIADILYASDWTWWKTHEGAKSFQGERWTSHSQVQSLIDDKSLVASEYPLRLVAAATGKGFSTDGARIHYGSPEHSGFQAVNLALLLGAAVVVLVGFDSHAPAGRTHFFGDHPPHLNRCKDEGYRHMARAYPPHERILNATPGSAITAYPSVDLDETIQRHSGLHRNRAESHAGADSHCPG